MQYNGDECLTWTHLRRNYITRTLNISYRLPVNQRSGPQNVPFPVGNAGSHLIHDSLDPQSPHPKRHLDWLSRFRGLTVVSNRLTDHEYGGNNRPHHMRPNNYKLLQYWYHMAAPQPSKISIHRIRQVASMDTPCMVPWAHPNPHHKRHIDRFFPFSQGSHNVSSIHTHTHTHTHTHRPCYIL